MNFPHFDLTVNVPTLIAGAGFLYGMGRKIAAKVNNLIESVDSFKSTKTTVTSLELRIKALETLLEKK